MRNKYSCREVVKNKNCDTIKITLKSILKRRQEASDLFLNLT